MLIRLFAALFLLVASLAARADYQVTQADASAGGCVVGSTYPTGTAWLAACIPVSQDNAFRNCAVEDQDASSSYIRCDFYNVQYGGNFVGRLGYGQASIVASKCARYSGQQYGTGSYTIHGDYSSGDDPLLCLGTPDGAMNCQTDMHYSTAGSTFATGPIYFNGAACTGGENGGVPTADAPPQTTGSTTGGSGTTGSTTGSTTGGTGTTGSTGGSSGGTSGASTGTSTGTTSGTSGGSTGGATGATTGTTSGDSGGGDTGTGGGGGGGGGGGTTGQTTGATTGSTTGTSTGTSTGSTTGTTGQVGGGTTGATTGSTTGSSTGSSTGSTTGSTTGGTTGTTGGGAGGEQGTCGTDTDCKVKVDEAGVTNDFPMLDGALDGADDGSNAATKALIQQNPVTSSGGVSSTDVTGPLGFPTGDGSCEPIVMQLPGGQYWAGQRSVTLFDSEHACVATGYFRDWFGYLIGVLVVIGLFSNFMRET